MLLYPANAALQLAFKQISSTCIFHAGSSTFPPSYAWSMIRSFISHLFSKYTSLQLLCFDCRRYSHTIDSPVATYFCFKQRKISERFILSRSIMVLITTCDNSQHNILRPSNILFIRHPGLVRSDRRVHPNLQLHDFHVFQ